MPSRATRILLLWSVWSVIGADQPVQALSSPPAKGHPLSLRSRQTNPRASAPLLHAQRSARPPPSARSPLSALVGSSAFRTVALSAVIALDITSYTFPLSFLPSHLAALGYGEAATSQLLSCFSLSALAAGVLLVVSEARCSTTKSARSRCTVLGASSLAMSAACAAQALWPVFPVIYLCRLFQGAISQLAWSGALAFAASLGPLGGLSAVSLVMVGNSIGEVSGPVFGAALYALGGFRLPFAAAAALALGLALALFASAAADGSSALSASDRQAAASPAAPMAAAQDDGGAAVPVPTVSTVEVAERAAGATTAGKPVGGDGRSPAPARTAALGDSRSLTLSLLLALSCGLVRSALDIMLPMWLRREHAFGVAGIAKASAVATLFFVGGSALSGRLLQKLDERRRDLALAVGALVGSAAAAIVLLPATATAVVAAYCLFYGASAFVGVAATTALEARGRQIHAADAILALSTLFWTAGFAVGGVVANVALSGGASAARQRLVLASVGFVNAACIGLMALTRRRRGRAASSGEIF